MVQSDLEYRDPVDTQSPEMKWARERAEMLQGLYIHFMVYAVIIAGLFVINWLTRGDDGSWWAIWPMSIWGMGVLLHVVVSIAPVFSTQWVDRKAKQIAGRH